MIKELLLAIVLGALLGFGVMGSYLAIHKKTTNNQPKTVEVSPTPFIENSISSENNLKNETLNIDTPEDNAVVSVSKIDFSGTTKPNSNIIITTLSKSFNTIASEEGKFSLSIDLESGTNFVKITSVDPDGNQTDISKIITYSTAKI